MNSLNSYLPKADHISYDEAPFVTFMEGVDMQLLHADVESGLWVVRIRMAPGVSIPAHKHTGEVFAITSSGSWQYLEYPEINTAGSYLYEPAGSVHTLYALESNVGLTEVWFAIKGANLNIDEEGGVESVWDAGFILNEYLRLCKEEGHDNPKIVGQTAVFTG